LRRRARKPPLPRIALPSIGITADLADVASADLLIAATPVAQLLR
jgi:hypothetical protein